MRFLDDINSGSKTTTSANALQAKQHSYHVLESSNVETVCENAGEATVTSAAGPAP